VLPVLYDLFGHLLDPGGAGVASPGNADAGKL
jgi:hypothetical protein